MDAEFKGGSYYMLNDVTHSLIQSYIVLRIKPTLFWQSFKGSLVLRSANMCVHAR